MKRRKIEASKIEALVEIRDYIREIVGALPQPICDDFNLIAKAIGIKSEEWCQPTE